MGGQQVLTSLGLHGASISSGSHADRGSLHCPLLSPLHVLLCLSTLDPNGCSCFFSFSLLLHFFTGVLHFVLQSAFVSVMPTQIKAGRGSDVRLDAFPDPMHSYLLEPLHTLLLLFLVGSMPNMGVKRTTPRSRDRACQVPPPQLNTF